MLSYKNKAGDNVSVSKNIKKYRTLAGLTQAELAELLNKSHNVVSNWEAGTNRPDVESIQKMLNIFQIDANTLFDWDVKKALSEENSEKALLDMVSEMLGRRATAEDMELLLTTIKYMKSRDK